LARGNLRLRLRADGARDRAPDPDISGDEDDLRFSVPGTEHHCRALVVHLGAEHHGRVILDIRRRRPSILGTCGVLGERERARQREREIDREIER
jgi:hypothetical protein